MADIATLGIAIDSSEVVKGAKDLDNLTAAGKKAEVSTKGLERSMVGASTKVRGAASANTHLSTTARQTAVAFDVQTAATDANSRALMANVASARQAAAIQRQLTFQLIDIGQAIPLAFQSPLYAMQNFGFQTAQIGQLYMGQGGFNAAIRDASKMVGGFIGRLGPFIAVAGAAGAALGGMTYEINRTTDAGVTMGDVLSGTMSVVTSAIMDELNPAIQTIAPYMREAWQATTSIIAAAINWNIRQFMVMKTTIQQSLEAGARIVGVTTQAIVNEFAKPISEMLNTVSASMNATIQAYNTVAKLRRLPTIDFAMGTVQLGGEGVKVADLPEKVGAILQDTALTTAEKIQQILSTDYAGDAFEAIAKAAQTARDARLAAAGAANDNGPITGESGIAYQLTQELNAAIEAEKAYIAQRQQFETPAERARREWSERMAVLEQARAQDIVSLTEYREQERRVNEAYYEAQMAGNMAMVNSTRQSFSTMLGVMQQFGGAKSGLYKTLFAIDQGYAIAQATIAMGQNMAQASKIGFPQNIPMIAAAAAQGASILASIQSAALVIGGGEGKSFMGGGYTGDGPTNKPVGVVEGQEFVFSAPATKRIGRQNLERMHNGGGMPGETGRREKIQIQLDLSEDLRGRVVETENAIVEVKGGQRRMAQNLQEVNYSMLKQARRGHR